jgi:hypothetical protein
VAQLRRQVPWWVARRSSRSISTAEARAMRSTSIKGAPARRPRCLLRKTCKPMVCPC